MERFKVLIIDDEEAIREILSFFIKCSLHCEIKLASNGQEALDLISKENFELIICDYHMPIKNGGDVYKHLLDINHPGRFIICSSDLPASHEEFNDTSLLFGHIQKPHLIPTLKILIERIKEEDTFTKVPDFTAYIPISTGLLLSLNIIPTDVFISLSENKFLKVFSQGAIFDETDYLKYKQKYVDNLYILNAATGKIIEKINAEIIKISDEANPENKLDSKLKIHGLIISTFKDFGFQKSLMPAVEMHIQETLDLCKSDKAFEMLLNNLFKKKDSYLGQHSFLLAAVTVTLASKIEWISVPTAHKLVISSLFHDIFLKETVTNELALMKGNITDEDFLTHPQKAADLLNKMPRIPPDTTKIIIEHHEQGEDIGFPRGIEVSKTSTLSQLFTFSHYFVDILFEMHVAGIIDNVAIYEKMKVISKKSPKYEKLYAALKSVEFF